MKKFSNVLYNLCNSPINITVLMRFWRFILIHKALVIFCPNITKRNFICSLKNFQKTYWIICAIDPRGWLHCWRVQGRAGQTPWLHRSLLLTNRITYPVIALLAVYHLWLTFWQKKRFLSPCKYAKTLYNQRKMEITTKKIARSCFFFHPPRMW